MFYPEGVKIQIMSLGTILREKREKLGLTLDEVSDMVDFSKPYLSTIETGRVKNPPSDLLLRRLEKVLKFKRGFLLRLAHVERTPLEIRREYEAAEAENEKLRQLATKLARNKSDKAKLKNIKSKLEVKKSAKPLAGRLVPIINKVTAGYPRDFDDLDYPVGVADDYVRCPDIHDPNAFAVRVVGDSMEPKFTQGDIVIFSPAAEVSNGDDCFVRFADPHETTFKRVYFERGKQVRLQPRNDKYSPLIIKNNRINGLYRAVIRYEKL